MFGQYFGNHYFGDAYFGGGSGSVPCGQYFGRAYFGKPYFGDPYFGPDCIVTPPGPPVVQLPFVGDSFPSVAFGTVLFVSIRLIPGKASGAAEVDGARIPIFVSVDAGEALGEFGQSPFQLSVRTTIKSGTARGEQNLLDEEMLLLLELV